MAKGSEFHVKLDGIKFSSETEKRIEAGIQSLILSELAGYKPGPDDPVGGSKPIRHLGSPVVIVKPRPWPGLIAIKSRITELDSVIKGIESKPGF